MKPIKITENHEEMVSIGKDIVKQKPNCYNEKILTTITEFVSERMPHAAKHEIEDTVYITIYCYWVYGCTYEECLRYDFPNKTHKQRSSYMTLRLRLQYVDHLSKREDAHLLFHKYETYQFFKDVYKRDVILCRSEEEYPVFMDFINKHPEFVVKPTDMSGGRGVHKASVVGLSDEQLKCFYYDMLGESKINQEKYRQGKEPSVVVEELIDQADEMAVFNPASTNAVRITTVRVNGKIHIYEPWFKIGRDGKFLTSAVFGTLDAGINAETGIVDTEGESESGEKWEYHPDSKIRISGFKIPHWEEVTKLATECALRLPTIGYVGWDFVLSKKGWCIMEGNYSGDFMWQLYRHKGMKKEFEELIGWKLDKKYWWENLVC